MRKILITNDDGIMADGLIRLVRAAKEFGEVWVVAPERERSAASHSLTLRSHIDVKAYDFPVEAVRAFSCSGTPADCVRVGIHGIMREKPHAVLSGINFGYNCATDIQYSATCGAAFEAKFQNITGIAVSEAANGVHEVTDHYLKNIIEEFIDKELPYGCIMNVNFPGCPLAECGGVLYDRAVSHGMFYRDGYELSEELPDGVMRYKVKGVYNEEAEPGTDFAALVDGYVSVGVVHNVGRDECYYSRPISVEKC